MQKITYQKKNGDILIRERFTGIPYRVGDITSMGWKVLDIKYSHNGKYYSRYEYDNIIDKEWSRGRKILMIKRNVKRVYYELSYIVLLLILFRFFEFSIKYIV